MVAGMDRRARSGPWSAAATTRSRSMPPTTRPQHHQGQPTVILAKTVKGYGMGEAGEGQNITHQQKKMGESHLHEFADRFGLPLTDEQIQKIPFLKLRRGQSPEIQVSARAAAQALGGYLPARRQKSASLEMPPLSAFDGPADGHRRAHDLDHHGVRAHPQHAAARQEDRQARGADRARRIAHLRHGGHVPPVRHLQPGRPALPAAGRRPADVLQGGQERPDPAGGDQRGRAPWRPGSRRRRPTAPTTCR